MGARQPESKRHPLPRYQRIIVAPVFLGICLLPAAAHAQILWPASLEDPIAEYLEAIEAAENEHGAYAPELSDLYSGLGKAYLDAGDFEKALDALHRGTLVVRVNSGLNSPEQVKYLFSVAEIENFLGEFRAADEVLESIRLINEQAHGSDPESLLQVYERLFEWYRTNRPLRGDLARFLDYRAVQDITANLASLSEQVKGFGHPDTARAYRYLGQSHFRTARFVLTHGDQIEQGVLVSFLGPPHVEKGELISVRDLFAQGRDAFEKYVQSVEKNKEHTPVEYAEALAQLGDWYLISEQPRTAWEKYGLAYRVLLESEGSKQLADACMGSPTPLGLLHEETGFAEFPDTPDGDLEERVRFSMTVTRYGDVRYVKILGAPDRLSDTDLRAIKDRLEQTVFRPRLDEGTVVRTKDYTWDFPVANMESNI